MNQLLIITALVVAAAAQSSPIPLIECNDIANETLLACGNHCELQCGDGEFKACTADCRPAACGCKSGFYRNTTGSCVTKDDCGPEPTITCANVRCISGCEMVFENGVMGPRCTPLNTTPITSLPLQCNDAANETMMACGNQCEHKCGDQLPKICTAQCASPACGCRDGFFRNTNGLCVAMADCAETGPSCLTAKCSAGHVCIMKQVQCIRAPCNPQPTCVPVSEGSNSTEIPMAPPGCAAMMCLYPSTCEEVNGVAMCSLTNVTSGNRTCGVNEHFNECGNRCEIQCGQPMMACPAICDVGACTCDHGYSRDTNGTCIRSERCNNSTAVPQCGRNEVWNECGAQCEGNCNTVNETQACIEICNPGACACQEGYYRNSLGVCVTAETCSLNATEQCGPNEEYNGCGNLAEGKCSEPNTTVHVLICSAPACSCKSGFYRNMVGDCVNLTDCVLDSPLTCATVDCITGHVCKMSVHPCLVPPCPKFAKCVKTRDNQNTTKPAHKTTCASVKCAAGEVCVLKEVQCFAPPCYPVPECVSNNVTQGCSGDEVFTDCTPTCEDTCRGVKDCPEASILMCRAGCKCPLQHRRDGNGTCVRNNQCFKNPGCQENEEYSKCLPCEKECGVDANANCNRGCFSGCACVSGYARDSTTNKCVPEATCPATTVTTPTVAK